MPRQARNPDRLSLHLGRGAKRMIQRAAGYSGKTLTDFVIDVAMQEAETIIRSKKAIKLTKNEWEAFEMMLLKPSSPNRRLRRAFAEHARVVSR